VGIIYGCLVGEALGRLLGWIVGKSDGVDVGCFTG
jgi:hypothetical protein